jgi:hypothetical protein
VVFYTSTEQDKILTGRREQFVKTRSEDLDERSVGLSSRRAGRPLHLAGQQTWSGRGHPDV